TMKRYLLALFAPFLLLAEPAYVPVPIQEHYSRLMTAVKRNRNKEVINEGRYITFFHKDSPFTRETHSHLALALHKSGKYIEANRHFTLYISTELATKYFDDAVKHKFAIAKHFEDNGFDKAFGVDNLLTANKIYSELVSLTASTDYFTKAVDGKFTIARYLEKKGFSQTFGVGNLEKANRIYTEIILSVLSTEYFSEAIERKFEIAKYLEKKGLNKKFGEDQLALATEIYTEIITSMPRSEMTAEALFRKGRILTHSNEYKDGIETYEMLIRRFPKSAYAPDGYLGIANVYIRQITNKFPDEELIARAQLNLDRFRDAFPSEPRLAQAEKLLGGMQERFAKELFEIGDFYQRTKKIAAAKIYYQTVLAQYPLTPSATLSAKRMEKIAKKEATTPLPA
ncbi:MAG: outer membrane protein assembly factor BamD, partial [Simkaniaceae bacterium]|nr:outer membrane protein assembly factor BamD [Simkaniaceae bacterium]